jgi:DNA-directed RNA polymerase specialized sigma24 family protein
MITEVYTTDEYGALPVEQAMLLSAHVRDGQSYEDLSARFKIPLGTVKSRISRGRQKIKRQREAAKQAEAA